MKILYIGFYSDEEIHAIKLEHKEPYYVAQFSYEQALCQQLQTMPDVEIEFVTLFQTGYYPKDKLFWHKKREKNSPFHVLGFLNLPFLRELSYFCSTLGQLIRWAVKYRKTKDKCVYSSTHFTPVSAAVVLFTKLAGIKRVVTFTDLSLFTFQESRIKNMPAYKRAVIKPYVKFTDLLQRSYDGYVLFSRQMDLVVNPKHKPFCVLEGIFNPGELDLRPVPKEDAIAHAGTLMRQVGIANILDTHGKLSLPTELWLMGDGDMRQEILARAERDERVKYLGFMPRGAVFEKLKAARLLVILRDPADAYTRYSFPSKVFEYMVSGTPVFMTRLEGIPEEYHDYIFFVEELDPEKNAAQLAAVLARPQAELDAFGMRARQFILEQKSPEMQSKKVAAFLRSMLS